ncbi:MAG: glycosyltransferase family 2 protein [Bacteroidales bacterium]|nr:glycosyltransferase family 2 protein [Bacteroidales bacterium]
MNRTADYQLTVIVPVYNEEDNINALEERLSAFVSGSAGFPACILFVNDGSTDTSRAKIEEVCGRQNSFFFINLKKNGGLSAAMKAGIDYTYSPYLGYIDADLQTAPEDFNLLIPYVGEYTMVMGIRQNRKDSFIKGISSKIANSFRRFMTKDGIEDTGCPLKILRTDYAKRIPLFTGMHRFLPALLMLQNGTVKQVPVRHFPRVAGKSKYNLANRLVGPFMDCFAYRWMMKRYINYGVSTNNLDK